MAQPAKTESEHRLHGTQSQKRFKREESYLTAGRPRYPKGLSPTARRVFKTLCGLLEERAALTKGDLEAIRLYCHLHERHARALAQLQEHGEICAYERLDSHGQRFTQYKKNLWLEVATGAERQMVAILVQLGLTPRSKDSIKPTRLDPKETVLPGSALEFLQSNVTVINRPLSVAPEEMEAGNEDEDDNNAAAEPQPD